MPFYVNPDWELDKKSIKQLVGENWKAYSAVEISISKPYFIFEDYFSIEAEESEKIVRPILFIENFDALLTLLTMTNQSECRISYFLPPGFANNTEIIITTVEKIFSLKRDSGEMVYIYQCKNGEAYSENGIEKISINLKKIKCIYSTE